MSCQDVSSSRHDYHGKRGAFLPKLMSQNALNCKIIHFETIFYISATPFSSNYYSRAFLGQFYHKGMAYEAVDQPPSWP